MIECEGRHLVVSARIDICEQVVLSFESRMLMLDQKLGQGRTTPAGMEDQRTEFARAGGYS